MFIVSVLDEGIAIAVCSFLVSVSTIDRVGQTRDSWCDVALT